MRNLAKPNYNSLSNALRADMTKKKENNVTNSQGMHQDRTLEIKETTKGSKSSTIQS